MQQCEWDLIRDGETVLYGVVDLDLDTHGDDLAAADAVIAGELDGLDAQDGDVLRLDGPDRPLDWVRHGGIWVAAEWFGCENGTIEEVA